MWGRGRIIGRVFGFDQALLASPQNPINGETTNSINNVTARLPIQGISPGSLFTESVFIGNYNSLQTSITKRMGHGFQFQGSYVWSKNLDEVNGEGGSDIFELQLPTNDQHHIRASSYGPADDDRDQRVVANFIWSAPKFTSFAALARHVLTDWEFSGIGVIQSGAALSVFDSNAGSIYGLRKWEQSGGNREQSYDARIAVLTGDRMATWTPPHLRERPKRRTGRAWRIRTSATAASASCAVQGSTTSTWRWSGFFR